MIEPPHCIKCGTELWHLVFVVDRRAMDQARLTEAADMLNTLADKVAEFNDTASDEALEVADRIRDVAVELRSIGDKEAAETEEATLVAVEDETGAVIEEKPDESD